LGVACEECAESQGELRGSRRGHRRGAAEFSHGDGTSAGRDAAFAGGWMKGGRGPRAPAGQVNEPAAGTARLGGLFCFWLLAFPGRTTPRPKVQRFARSPRSLGEDSLMQIAMARGGWQRNGGKGMKTRKGRQGNGSVIPLPPFPCPGYSVTQHPQERR
jgi:hypothetical protein